MSPPPAVEPRPHRAEERQAVTVIMLSFDIETEGLDPAIHRITVAAVCDRAQGIRRCYNFLLPDAEATRDEFLHALDTADGLYAFNGVAFDLPFIIKRFSVPASRYEPWFIKLFDYYEVAKRLFDSSFGLNKLLEHNGFAPKSSCGMQAVIWAREAEYDKLSEYCQDDADLTYDISTSLTVSLPLKGRPPVVALRNAHDSPIHTFRGQI